MLKILALDGATRICGYALLIQDEGTVRLTAVGNIILDEKLSIAYRLADLADKWTELIKKYEPTQIAIEDLKFNPHAPNLSSLSKVAMAIGVAQSISAKHLFEPILLTASTVRARIENTAKGSKKKDETRRIVNFRFKADLEKLGFPDGLKTKHNDISDAIALGWTAFSECKKT